jgi:hypothetical protein
VAAELLYAAPRQLPQLRPLVLPSVATAAAAAHAVNGAALTVSYDRRRAPAFAAGVTTVAGAAGAPATAVPIGLELALLYRLGGPFGLARRGELTAAFLRHPAGGDARRLRLLPPPGEPSADHFGGW